MMMKWKKPLPLPHSSLQWILQNFVELNSKKLTDKETTFTSTFQVIFHSISKFPWFWRVCSLINPPSLPNNNPHLQWLISEKYRRSKSSHQTFVLSSPSMRTIRASSIQLCCFCFLVHFVSSVRPYFTADGVSDGKSTVTNLCIFFSSKLPDRPARVTFAPVRTKELWF